MCSQNGFTPFKHGAVFAQNFPEMKKNCSTSTRVEPFWLHFFSQCRNLSCTEDKKRAKMALQFSYTPFFLPIHDYEGKNGSPLQCGKIILRKKVEPKRLHPWRHFSFTPKVAPFSKMALGWSCFGSTFFSQYRNLSLEDIQSKAHPPC